MPSRSIRYGTASRRMPSTPRSSQNRITSTTAAEHARIVEIQIGLVRVEAMPIIGLRHRVPRPVRFFGIDEDDAGFREFLVGIAPDIKIAQLRAGFRPARALKPGMLIGGVIDDSSVMTRILRRCASRDEGLEIRHLAV